MLDRLQKVCLMNGSELYVRENTLDFYIYEEIFVRDQYRIKVEDLRKFVALKETAHPKPKTILDLGGNIGLASVYFANQYPDAQIYTVEPDRENFELLQKNVSIYANVHPIWGAIWDKEEPLHIANRHDITTRSGRLNKASYQMETGEKEGEETVQSFTINGLMKKIHADVIDICKIDIQGAEKRIFQGDTAWLDRTRYLFVETHDRYVEDCFYTVVEAAHEHGFVYIGASGRDGDVLFFVKKGNLMPFVEMIVTTKCNLRCRECSNLIPAYTTMTDVPFQEICASVDALLECVNEILYFKIHGGEPMLHHEFVEILKYAAKQDKIKKIIVPTNGSYIPKTEVLQVMGEYREKVTLVISNYEQCRALHGQLLQLCDEYRVSVELSEEKLWYTFGKVKLYSETAEQFANKIRNCEMKRFPSYYKGGLYWCSRMANGVYTGLIPCDLSWEYPLLQVQKAERIEEFIRFLECEEHAYCRYCTMNNIRCAKSGEQIK